MSLLNILKKKKNSNSTTENGVLGPSFLEGLTENIQNPKELLSHEWRRKLKSSTGNTKFIIKFYGQIHDEYQDLIIGTDFAPSLVIAVEETTGEEIIVFDGCKHGYNAMFCDTYTEEQIKNRPVCNTYKDKEGNEKFEIIISTYYGTDFDNDFLDEVDENGFLKLIDGSKTEFENAKRNAYDTLQIWAINEKAHTFNIISEELA